MHQLGPAGRIEQDLGLLAHALVRRVQKQLADGFPQRGAPRLTRGDMGHPGAGQPPAEMQQQRALAASVDALEADESAGRGRSHVYI